MNDPRQPAVTAFPAHPGLFRWPPFWLFAAFILTLGLISYAVYERHKKETVRTELGLLSAIADLKVEAIRKWKNERRGDAEVVSHAPFFVRGFEQWLKRGMPPDDTREMILERLRMMQRTYGYQEILMFDARGKPILSTDPRSPAHSAQTQALVDRALEMQTAQFLDIGSSEDPQNMGIASPILAAGGGKPRAIGAIYLRIHPSWLPFTLAELPQRNRESIKVHLVRREGNEAKLLDMVSGEGARFLRRPLSRTDLPSVMAALGEESNEWVDYSGTPVFTQHRRLPDSEWSLVVQVNQEEVYTPLRQIAWLVAGSLAALFILGEMTMAMWWRSQRAELAVRRYKAEEAIRISQARFATIFDQSPVGIAVIDSLTGKIHETNRRFAEIAGRTIEEMAVLDWMSITHPDDVQEDLDNMARLNAGKISGFRMDKRYIRPDGSSVWINMTVAPLTEEQDATPRHLCMIDDITERKQHEEILRYSAHRLKEAQRIAHIGDWNFDLVENKLSWSEEIYRIFEFDPEKFIPSYEAFLNTIHPDDRERVDKAYTDSVSNRTPYDIEHRLLMKDGRVKYVGERCETYYGEDGKPLRSFGTIHDITERKQNELALSDALVKARRFSDALDNVAAYIYLKNRQYQYIHANRPTLELFRCSAEELVGSDDSRFFPPETVAHLREVDHRVLERGESTREEIPVNNHLGQRIYWETKSPIYNDQGEIVGLCGISYDITERKQMEAEVRKLNAELEQRVLERTARLEAANKELESFAYSVSHDLRVPLRAVDGFSQLLLAHHEDRLDEEGRRLLHVVRDNAQKMGHLIDDILAFSRAGRLEMRQTAVDMEAAARDAWQELELSRAGREVHLDIGPLPGAHGDPAMLRQVWINLLGNAIKFTKYRAAAHIEVGGSAQNGEQVFYVKDDGAGFDMQYADKLFGMFQRLHGVEEFEGTGIGLAIVKRIVTRHGGRVWAESKVGEGATLYFALPHPAHQAAT